MKNKDLNFLNVNTDSLKFVVGSDFTQSEINKRCANILKTARKNMNMLPAELGDILGKGEAQIHRYEGKDSNDQQSPNLFILQNIFKLLNIQPNDFFSVSPETIENYATENAIIFRYKTDYKKNALYWICENCGNSGVPNYNYIDDGLDTIFNTKKEIVTFEDRIYYNGVNLWCSHCHTYFNKLYRWRNGK